MNMVIKASASTEVRQLVAALGGDDDVAREAAIARLAIVGNRAVDRLLAAYKADPPRRTRVAILRALEPLADGRTLGLARDALRGEGDLAIAGASVLRALLDSPHEATAGGSLDALVSVALDPAAARRARLAAFEALQEMPSDVRERVSAALQADPDGSLKARAAEAPREAAAADAVWQDALDGRVPDRPSALRDVLQIRGATAPVTALQRLIDLIHQREGSMEAAPSRAEWRAVRGALHQALALRGSRLAVYDLRESIEESRDPLPVSFLAALHVIGDSSCLEPLAAAHARAADPRYALQVQDAFRAIARREHLTPRSALLKKIAERWPGISRY
jgi:hypothetical protein